VIGDDYHGSPIVGDHEKTALYISDEIITTNGSEQAISLLADVFGLFNLQNRSTQQARLQENQTPSEP